MKANNRSSKPRLTREQLKTAVPREQLLAFLSNEIEKITQAYYNKYKCIACVDINDIRSEVIIFMYTMFDKLSGSKYELKYGSKKTFLYFAKRNIHILNNRLGNYVYGMTTDRRQSQELLKMSAMHRRACPADDNSYTNNEIINFIRDEYNSNCNVNDFEKNRTMQLYYQIMHRGIEDVYFNTDIVCEYASYEEARRLINEVMHRFLTREEREVLELRFGLTDGRARTLDEVGYRLEKSSERVRQIEAKALRKLRGSRTKGYGLVEFLE